MNDLFGRPVRLPAGFDREGRVLLVAEVAAALIEGRVVPRTAALLVGSALQAWLNEGGSLERDYLRISAPRSSHRTPQHLWRELASSRGTTTEGDDGTMREDLTSDVPP